MQEQFYIVFPNKGVIIIKYFIITIDTEGDNLWAVKDISQNITTENADYIYRFQELCEKYNFVPTYLTNYEMAISKPMIELGREGIKNNTLEIGAHIHSWNQPPMYKLVKGVGKRGKPYLGEYPNEILIQKIDYLTKTLEDTFQVGITSHRGGRWYFDNRILNELVRLNYLVDCSCTPGVSWRGKKGWTSFSKGSDWENYPNAPFFLNSNENKKILEIPVTIKKISDERTLWFRPDGNNKNDMLRLIKNNSNNYIEFMLHSSELMPGGSPTFRREWQISKLYYDLETIFSELQKAEYKGIGVTDFSKLIRDDIKMERKI